jgi:hypothetical protein
MKSGSDPLDLWLLLGDAVDCAHAPDEGFAVDWNDAARGKEFLQGVDGAFVIGVIKHGGQNDVVGDVEVCVTRW